MASISPVVLASDSAVVHTSSLAASRAQFDLAITAIGRKAARTLEDHRVPPEPMGRIQEQMFQTKRVVKTGDVWRFSQDIPLFLLPDGRWWVLSKVDAGFDSWQRSRLKGNPILSDKPTDRLDGEKLIDFNPSSGVASGKLFWGYEDLFIWLIDGTPMINSKSDPLSSIPFHEWAAEGVARLLNR